MPSKQVTPEQLNDLSESAFIIDVPAKAPPAVNTSIPGRVFTEEEVEAIRKQEKDKLYQTIEKEKERVNSLSTQLDQYTKEREEAARIMAEEANRQDEARKAREQEELSAKELIAVKETEWNQKLTAAETGWSQKLEALQAERDATAALLAQEQHFQSVLSYKNRRLQEVSESVVPEFVQLLEETSGFGNSEEEVERAISALVTKSSSMLENIQQSTQQQRLRGVSPTGGAPTGPLDNIMEQQTVTANDIKNMSLADYAKVRDRLMAQARPYRG
jgi:chromosome segregation ATPase